MKLKVGDSAPHKSPEGSKYSSDFNYLTQSCHLRIPHYLGGGHAKALQIQNTKKITGFGSLGGGGMAVRSKSPGSRRPPRILVSRIGYCASAAKENPFRRIWPPPASLSTVTMCLCEAWCGRASCMKMLNGQSKHMAKREVEA